jgi:hypothetical protein
MLFSLLIAINDVLQCRRSSGRLAGVLTAVLSIHCLKTGAWISHEHS